MKIVWLFLAIFAFIMFSSTAMFLSSEDFIIGISEEDKPIENLNAANFLISSLVGLYFYFTGSVHRKMLLVLSVVSMTGFLDELSFGARIIGFQPPMVMGTTLDAAHDLFYIGVKLVYKLTLNYPFLMVPSMILGILLFTFILLKYRFRLMEEVKKFYIFKPSFLLASFFIITLFLALVIDLGRIENEFLFLIEELFELNAAIALFFLIISLQRNSTQLTVSEYAIPSGNLNSGILVSYIAWQTRLIKKIIRSKAWLTNWEKQQ